LFFLNAQLFLTGGDNIFGSIADMPFRPDDEFVSNFQFLNDNSDLAADARLLLTQRDPGRRLLALSPGGLGLSEISLGDIFSPGVPLLSREVEGRGLIISSMPLDMPTEFAGHTIRGDLPTGWKVELFRGNALLETQRSSSSGRYAFTDLPLLMGDNRFRVEFFGPQGQRRTETVTIPGIPLGRDDGRQFFRLAYTQEDRRVLPFAENQRDGPPRLFGEYGFLITPGLTLTSFITSMELDDEDRHATLGLGVRFDSEQARFRINAVDDLQSGKGFIVSAQAKLLGVDLFAERGRFIDLESELLGVDEPSFLPPFKHITELRADTVLPEIGMVPEIVLNASYLRRVDELEFVEQDSDFTISTAFGDTFVSNTFFVQQAGDPFFEFPTVIFNDFFFSSRLAEGFGSSASFLRDIHLSGVFSADLQPVLQLARVTLTAETMLPNKFTAKLDFTRDIHPIHATSWRPEIGRRFGSFAISANAEITDDGAQTFGISLTTGAVREPLSGRVRGHPDRNAANGAASIRAFVDSNANGVFDIGETILQGIRFQSDATVQIDPIATDLQGIAFLTGLPPFQEVAIFVEPSSPPGLVPSVPGFRIIPRPGVVAAVDFPFVERAGFGTPFFNPTIQTVGSPRF
ncbi:MAG: hypothetical protein O7C63_09975, partial [Alphaproteobacteria bacterium]|nr:hypothetical protein [Alphaproteobacteria bacterium]